MADRKGFSVPRVIESLSSKQILTSTFVNGIPLEKVMQTEDQETRDWVNNKFNKLNYKYKIITIIHNDYNI